MALPLRDLKDNFPMSQLCTTQVGGTAKHVCFVRETDDLIDLLAWCRDLSLPVLVIGGGANILCQDAPFDGMLVRMMTSNISRGENDTVYADAGVPFHDLIEFCAKEGLSGVEDLTGVPGTVGGGVFGNVGAHDQMIGDIVLSVDVINAAGDVEELSVQDIWFSYRTSSFKSEDKGYIILGTLLQMTPEVESGAVAARVQEIYERKKATQPLGKTCGSYFKNPEGHAAWKLIDDCGLRGVKVGGAQVSEMHCNFLINAGDATQADFTALEELIISKVQEQFDITLEREIRKMGEDF